ncbi:MAG: MoxR family ATPase [Gammaproteobacteria bacterium]|jgi:MoxR-like ATPase|nr:MoxR family ATPase [Gammaproteobacteria bacterium]
MTSREAFRNLAGHVATLVVGQEALVRRLLIALLANGHLLVEGAPGLAKTRAIKALASGLEADFHRIQFTPDLLPADVTGSDVYQPTDGNFRFQPGPIFHNLLLADEVNRAPAKVQSALLEAMGERQVTVGAKSYPLPDPFLVMATQNPIEQEGTYPLPEAQLDRFMLHVTVGYPSRDASRRILELVREEALGNSAEGPPVERLAGEAIRTARAEVLTLHLSTPVEDYIIELVEATRRPGMYGNELSDWIAWGASPRGAIAIEHGARALAWLDDRDFVTPEDVRDIAPDALRHRVLPGFEAEAEGITATRVIDEILAHVPAP